MSPLLIFILVVLFIVGGLMLLRDTAFLNRKPSDRQRHRQQTGGDGGSGISVDTAGTNTAGTRAGSSRTDKNADTREGDVDASTDGGGDGGGD